MIGQMTAKKNLDLEFLRALAIGMTVLQHAEVLMFWPGNWHQRMREWVGLWTGVDLFFCISGFIITHTLLASLRDVSEQRRESAGLSVRQAVVVFWIKRVWRLWPAAWCALVLAVLCAAFFNASGVYGDPWRMVGDAVAAFFHVANFHWAGCYLGALERCNMIDQAQIPLTLPTGWALVVYWSLSLEEQFYLVAPLMIALSPRRRLVLILALVWIALVPWSRPPLGIAWFFRVDALVLGVLLAFWRARPAARAIDAASVPWSLSRRAWVLFLCAVAMTALACLGAPGPAGGPGAVSLISLAAAVLVGVASLDRRVLMPRGVAGQALTWLGARSYSLYLVHMLAYFATREAWFRLGWSPQANWPWYLLGALLLTMGLAEASYRWVEQPARQHGYRLAARFAQRRLVARGAREAGR